MTTKPTFPYWILLIVHCSLILLLGACATQTTQPTTQSIPAHGSIHQDLPPDTSADQHLGRLMRAQGKTMADVRALDEGGQH